MSRRRRAESWLGLAANEVSEGKRVGRRAASEKRARVEERSGEQMSSGFFIFFTIKKNPDLFSGPQLRG